MLERMVYVSQAMPGTRIGDVCHIIRASHARNAAFGVTGVLVCLDGWFVQFLEGPPEGLDVIYGGIAADRRHVAPDLRIRERALCRLFPDQSMALRMGPALEPDLLAEFGYRPGFPVEAFPAALLTEFMVGACYQRGPRRGLTGGTGHPGMRGSASR